MEVPQELLAADYVLFYAQIHSFPEDNQLQCRLKVAARQLYWAAARKMDLQIDKLKLQLPVAKDTPKRKKWAPYQSTYWGFRAKDVDVLLHEAEFVKMEMPLKATETTPLCCPDDEAKIEGDNPCCCGCLQPETTAIGEAEEAAITDENADFICAPFIFKKKHMFFGGGRDGSEFRLTGAQRIYLTYSRLQRIDIGLELRKAVRSDPELLGCPPSCMYCKSLRTWLDKEDSPIVLEHLLESNVFADAFAMHDAQTSGPAKRPTGGCGCRTGGGVVEDADTKSDNGGGDSRDGWRLNLDLRYQLSRSWDCCCRFQPLRLIRLYFGERLAFYYAWFGYIIWCLLFLTAIGLCFFVYGLANASVNYKNSSIEFLSQLSAVPTDPSVSTALSVYVVDLMQFILLTFENHLTIVFGCILTVWSLLTTEAWKRYESSLSYRWDVNHHYIAENRRPAYVLRKSRCQPIWCTQQTTRRKCIGFYSCVLSCVILVFAITVGFQVARLVGDRSYCTAETSAFSCFIVSTVLPITGQVIVISILDSLYSVLAKAVTNWECHEYPTDYDNSFAIKAFAFRFANNYAPLFYIAFVRQGRIKIGSFSDSCTLANATIDCFNLLNITTAGYMVGKSLLKSGADIMWPYLKRSMLTGCTLRGLRGFLRACCPCIRMLGYSVELEILAELERNHMAKLGETRPSGKLAFAEQRHLVKSKEQEMLLDEYLEKVILYGFMTMFGSAFYLAPAVALIAMAIDLRLDSKRLLFLYRRPVPLPAPGIGVWNWLLDFLSFAGIFTTGAILAFTSQSLSIYGVATTDSNRLIFFIVFENAMLAIKFLLVISIGDMPRKLKLCLKWEYFYVKKILTDDKVEPGVLASLQKMQDKNRWYHALCPCCATITTPNPEAGPQLV
ncbi:hypothetical protein BOX15_Mlig023277g1 [Macrostomum lignano]|uniref:Anoctamin n=1 Tax=Macrostomum lignano TaxID=282301 RepID=A0A267EYW6_9PLAT|nr:hypothetical protein BOX15_Mlig023277g1 [Macrostomum lignano]